MADIKAKKVLFKNRDGESLIPYIGEDYVKQEDMVEIGFVPKDSMQEIPCIVETYVNGTSWYRVWSDGFKEQCGHAPNGNNAEYILSFLIPFSNTDYKIFKCNNWLLTSNVTWQFLNFWNKTTTTATTHNANQTNGGSGFDWYACGY